MNTARFVRSFLATLAAGSLVALAAGCPGTLTEEEKILFGGGACPDMPVFLATKCGSVGCHAPGASPAGALDLASPGVEGRVVSVAATQTCGGVVLANPIDPEGSLLYTKLLDTPPCGLKMPLGGSLSAVEINCVKTWIENLDPQQAGAGGMGGAGGAGGAGGMGGAGGAGGM